MVSILHKQGNRGVVGIIIFPAGRQNGDGRSSERILCPDFRRRIAQPFIVERLNQLSVCLIIFFIVGDKYFVYFELADDDRRAADMVGIGMRQHEIVQFFDFLLLQIVLNLCAFGVIARINQHGMPAADNQCGIALPHIQKMHFHFIRARRRRLDGNGQAGSGQNRSRKYQIHQFSV